jgi:hypothetical protein
VLSILRQFCNVDGHHFWPEDISIRELLVRDVVVTHAHVTDVYLLGLAVHKEGKLATLDRRIPVAAVASGAEALELVPA